MLGTVEMFGGVFVERSITAMGNAAGLASTQMHPMAAYFDTLRTFVSGCSFYFF
jgi:hypothetical protein